MGGCYFENNQVTKELQGLIYLKKENYIYINSTKFISNVGGY